MGLPGAGKTTLAQDLVELLEQNNHQVTWLNADYVRQAFDDWDFSYEGRIRQAHRMNIMASQSPGIIVCDFVAPLKEMRDIFNADITVWVDTIQSGRFEDTNKVFEIPCSYDIKVTEQNSEKWSKIVAEYATNLHK